MRSKYLLVGVVVGVLFSLAAIVLAGNLDPANPPASTSSYTLEDIYNRLNAGTAGSESTFTEPSSGPETGTMHTLNDLVGAAPAVDDTHGAAPGEVLASKTYWGLSSGAWGPQVGTGAGAGVPKTGQTTAYPPGNRDDGDLEKGVAWPIPRFTDNGNGTVTDNLTGLIWLKNANCTDTVGSIVKSTGTLTWTNALTWSNNLASGDCGLSDSSSAGEWRLPNMRELYSLIDFSQYNPPLPNDRPFENVESDYYWSSTTDEHEPAKAWYVYLVKGDVLYDPKTYGYYVWPVRGGQ